MFSLITSLFKNTSKLIIGVLNIAFLISIVSYYISPRIFLSVAPMGLFFIPLFLFHLVLFVYLLRKSFKKSIYILLLLLISFPIAKNVFSFHLPNTKAEGLKVLSWNVKNFDIYNWSKDKDTREKMVKLIADQKADVMCFQEFFSSDSSWNMINEISALGYPYYYFESLVARKTDNAKWGLAIFSKYPINKKRTVKFQNKGGMLNQCIVANVNTPNGNLDVYNAHFQSMHFDYKDYEYIDNVMVRKEKLNRDNIDPIMSKITGAYVSRQEQIERVKSNIEKEADDRYLICCDLNDVSSSYAYKILSSDLNDAFVKRGMGLSATTSVPIPLFRIDYIFTSKNIEITNYKCIKNKLSDHNLISARII